jgi:hypothetical protein
MSTDRDVTRIVRSWLDEGVTALPDRVLDAVLDQLPATPQRRAWWPAWRFPLMNKTVRIALVAAAVVVIAVVAFNLLPGSPAPGGEPSATPEPDLTGTLTLDDQGAWPALQVGADCEGQGGFSDITEGAQVVVTNEAQDIIATGSLGPGRIVTTGTIGSASLLRVCVFDIAVPDVPDAEFYTVEVSPPGAFNYSRMVEVFHLGTIDYSRAELDNMDWHVSLVVR